jgi:ferrous iron transport protein A
VHELIPLTLVPDGQLAAVEQILGLPEHVHRLHEMGLRDGTTIEMIRCGSPCIIRLAGQRLCFRADEALSVLVRLQGHAP